MFTYLLVPVIALGRSVGYFCTKFKSSSNNVITRTYENVRLCQSQSLSLSLD